MDSPDSLPSGQYAVYALVDPTDNLVYYVGQTRNPKERLNEHLKMRHYPQKKTEWVRNLKEKGQKPLMQTLEVVLDEVTALTKEQEWIRHFVKQGMPLLNAQAQLKQAKEAVRLRQEVAKEPVIPLKQGIVMVAGYPITIVWLPDNSLAATLSSLCAMLGIRPDGQARRIRRDEYVTQYLLLALVETLGGPQRLDVLIAENIPDWIMGLQLKRIAPEKRSLILALKIEIVDVLHRYFFAVSPDQQTG